MPSAKTRIPILTLLTDFGNSDHYVAAMKGVVLEICPVIQFVDISHEVKAFDIADGAYTLAQSAGCFPKGTVHLVVVDPGVGSARRAILATVGGQRFVAPDNGVLGMVFAAAETRGDKISVRQITAEKYFHHPVSSTFHGRDLFSPVAAHWAKGTPAARFGPEIVDFFRPAFSAPFRVSRRSWLGTVLKVDHFGNLITNFSAANFPLQDELFQLQIGLVSVQRLMRNYAQASTGELFVLQGSGGFLEVSLREGNAAEALGVKSGAPVELQF